MKKIMTKTHLKTIILSTSLLLAIPSFADIYSTDDGLAKIKNNLDNSKENQGEYAKNLEIVNKNLAEITKAKNSVQKQKDSVTQQILSNNESFKKSIMQEKEVQQLIAAEKQKQEQERIQLEQLEKTVAQIKQNQMQREALITEYSNQLLLAQEDKKSWKARDTELRTQEVKTIQSLRGLASEESTWTNKQKGYEIEVKRWASEVEKQQKINSTYNALKGQEKQ